jgi:integral membrane protein (TIGR01906 family)
VTASVAPLPPPAAAWMRIVEYVLFVAGFTVAGLVVFALLWSGEAPYRDLARDNGVDRYVFVLQPPASTLEMDRESAVGVHAMWSRYVTGGTDQPPAWDPPLFTADEYAHMADVRRVFDVARFLVPLGLFLIIVRLQRARARGSAPMWRLARNGTLIAAAIVVVIGVVAVFAFEPLFLAFHYLFFPQGNFLFDPATSNLIRLYPDWYWEGISVRVGLSFIALALVVAGVASLRLRAAK